MIQKLVSYILSGTQYSSKHPQVVLTVLLTLGIPFAFIFSGQQFLNASKANQDTLMLERVGTLQDVLIELIPTKQTEPEIRDSLKRIVAQNNSIVDLALIQETQGAFNIVSSAHDADLNKSIDRPAPFKASAIHNDRSLAQFSAVEGIRYLDAYRSFTHNGVQHYLYTKMSLEQIDVVLSSRVREAYIWLCFVLIILMYLLMRHIRLIDYAYLYNEVRKSNEMKDMFTNMIAHELRSPLTAMRGFASMIIESKNPDEKTTLYAQNISNASERLLQIVNDLLDVARIHSGKLSITQAACNLSTTVSDVISLMQAFALEKDITITDEIHIKNVMVYADEKRLFQAISNLVSNSLKYTKAGEIKISVEERTRDIELRIKDTGIGMSANDQKKLFAPFFRVQSKETENTIGTGLGMWITRELIVQMGGSIDVESIRGVGTHVVITLKKPV